MEIFIVNFYCDILISSLKYLQSIRNILKEKKSIEQDIYNIMTQYLEEDRVSLDNFKKELFAFHPWREGSLYHHNEIKDSANED
jgi:hypothetical protein